MGRKGFVYHKIVEVEVIVFPLFNLEFPCLSNVIEQRK